MTRRWTINGRFLTQPLTGVQRYAREIVRSLDELVADGHPLAAGLEMEIVAPADATDPGPLRVIGFRTAGARSGHVWEQTALPSAAPGGLLSLCNTGPLAARKHIVCMHDVNTRACPRSYSLPFRMLYRALLPALGRTARTVTTVSNYSAEELARYGIAPRKRIKVMPDGHEHALRWFPRHSPETMAAAGLGTVVMIGSAAPHKNVKLILGMAEELADIGVRVAVVGMADGRVFSADRLEAPLPNVAWLGRVGDDELAALLRDSMCLAFPSLVEGFGLPALEAMATGCPVVASDAASLPEICGNAALLADPESREAWLTALRMLRQDPALRRRLAAAGRERARRFSWRRSAELYLEEMARLDAVVPSEALYAPAA